MNSSKSIRESSPGRQLIDYRVPKCRRLSRSITSRFPSSKKKVANGLPALIQSAAAAMKKKVPFILYIFPALFIEKKERPLSVAHYYSEPSSTIASCVCVYKHVGTETGPESCPRLVSRPVSLSLPLARFSFVHANLPSSSTCLFKYIYKKLYEHHLYILFVYKDCFNWDKRSQKF